MAILFTDSYRDNICVKIANRLGQAQQQGEIDAFDFQDACKALLAAITTISSHEQLETFLIKLGAQWPCFTDVLDTLKSDQKSVEKIEQMFYARAVHK